MKNIHKAIANISAEILSCACTLRQEQCHPLNDFDKSSQVFAELATRLAVLRDVRRVLEDL